MPAGDFTCAIGSPMVTWRRVAPLRGGSIVFTSFCRWEEGLAPLCSYPLLWGGLGSRKGVHARLRRATGRERTECVARSSIQRFVLRQTLLEILHNLIRIIPRFPGALGPLGIERLGSLAPFGELFGRERVEFM